MPYLQRPRVCVCARSCRDAPFPEHGGVGGGAWSNRVLLRYSNKNRNFGRVFALLTEKRQNVCSRRVESVWMGEGGRFGRGCGAAKSKTKWHWSDPHIVLDKDAAQTAAGARPIKLQITRRTQDKERSTGVFCSVAHAASAPPCSYRPARCFCWRLSTVQTWLQLR